MITKKNKTAFTLLEAIISMAIFAIGFASLSSLFYIGAVMQKETIKDNNGIVVTSNATSITDAMYGDFDFSHMKERQFSSLSISIADRSYPSTVPLSSRMYFWFPLAFRGEGVAVYTKTIYIFVLKRNHSTIYHRWGDNIFWANREDGLYNENYYVPGIFLTPVKIENERTFLISGDSGLIISHNLDLSHIGPGDKILDDFGYSHIIEKVEDGKLIVNGLIRSGVDYIWCVPRGKYSSGKISKESPILEIKPISIRR